MLISIVTGFAAGAAHVLGGADHLVSMAPNSMREPRQALRDGLSWGIGHSTGVLILSAVAILAKDLVNVEMMSSVAEFVVGLTLLIVGVLAIRAALGVNIHKHNHQHGVDRVHQHFHFHFLGNKKHSRHAHAATGLGVIHGLAGGGHLLAVIPALALPPFGAFIYMFSYLIGSIASMCTVVLGISMASGRLGQKLSKYLMTSTGVISISIGFFWLQKTSGLLL